jgi:hypothetical protein
MNSINEQQKSGALDKLIGAGAQVLDISLLDVLKTSKTVVMAVTGHSKARKAKLIADGIEEYRKREQAQPIVNQVVANNI